MDNLLSLENIMKYADDNSEHTKHLILDNINLTIKKRQIISILGKSGSGKSTLLRIIANLITPSSGSVNFNSATEHSDNHAHRLSMIFQSFALLPWLNVSRNVELALESQKLPLAQVKKLAGEAINLVGLHGFEHAYPKELSGGMKQRVGFARALVVNPQILLMDEAFSALDILTAETLKSDLMDLWLANKLNLQAIIMVTHNIEEAVALSDRVLIMSTNPGRIMADIPVLIKQPRNRYDLEFKNLVNEIYSIMTTQTTSKVGKFGTQTLLKSIYQEIPFVSISKLIGLLEIFSKEPYNGCVSLETISMVLNIDFSELSPTLEALNLLNFVTISDGQLELTSAGHTFVEASIINRKKIFAKHIIDHLPLISFIRAALQKAPNQQICRKVFLDELSTKLLPNKAVKLLDLAVTWGRYAEIYTFNNVSKLFTLKK